MVLLGERRDKDAGRPPALEKELGQVEARVKRLTEAVAKGEGTDALLDALEVEQAKKRDLERQVAEMTGASKAADADAAQFRTALRKAVADVKGLLGQSVSVARQMLRRILVDRVRCEAYTQDRRCGYRFAGSGSFGRLLAGEASFTTTRTPLGSPAPLAGKRGAT